MLDQQSAIKVQQRFETADSIASTHSTTPGKSYSAVPFQFKSAAPDALEDVEKSSTNDAENAVAVPIFPTVTPIATIEPANPILAKLASSEPSVTPVQFATNLTSIKSLPAPAFQFSRHQPEQEEEEDLTETKIKADPIQQKPNTSGGMPAHVQAQMEGAFSADFSDVSIHANSESASKVGALAYTQGSAIHFAAGQYDPQSAAGQELLGHELTHVVQQREGRVQATTTAAGLPVNDDQGLEAEADEGGRKAVQFKVDPTSSKPLGSHEVTAHVQGSIIQRTLNTEQLNRALGIIHDRTVLTASLVGTGPSISINQNQSEAVRVLREQHGNIEQIKTAFQERYHIELKTFIKNNYTDDMRVKATALLYEPTYLSPWTSVALALIPNLTRDGRFFQIMTQEGINRELLRNKYEELFGELGAGNIHRDVEADFDNADEARARILIYRNLTDADNLYLAAAGQWGTDAVRVLAIIRRVYGYGTSAFTHFLNQWNPTGQLEGVISSGAAPAVYFDIMPGDVNAFNVISRNGLSLMFTVLSELSGADKAVPQQIFIEHILRLNHAPEPTDGEGAGEDPSHTAAHGWSFTFEEESQCRIARTALEAAEDRWIDDDTEKYTAIQQIMEVYRQRIRRLESAHASQEDINAATLDMTNAQGRLERDHLTFLTGIYGLLNLYTLDDADRLWLARGNHEQYNSLLRRHFIQNNMESVKTQALLPHVEDGRTVRQAFNLSALVLHASDPHYNLVEGSDRGRTGQRFLEHYLQEQSTENLSFIRSFLLDSLWDESDRDSLLSRFQGGRHPENSPKQYFIRYLGTLHFDTLSNFPSIRDVWYPPTSDANRLTRARLDRRHDEENSGPLGGLPVDFGDAITGEDTRAVVDESVDTLSLFANDSGATAEEMELFRAFYGATVDLSALQYQDFQQSLGELQAARTTIAQVVSTIVSTALEAVLTPFITPVGAAIVGQLAGILLSEAMDAQGTEVFSMASLQAVAVGAVSAGAGNLLENGSTAATLIERHARSSMVRGAIREGFQASATGATTVFFEAIRGNLSSGALAEQLRDLIASTLAGAITGYDIPNPAQQQRFLHQFGEEVLTNITQNILQTNGELLQNLAEGENVDDSLEQLGRAIAEAIRDSVIESVGEHAGESIHERIRRRQDQRSIASGIASESPQEHAGAQALGPSDFEAAGLRPISISSPEDAQINPDLAGTLEGDVPQPDLADLLEPDVTHESATEAAPASSEVPGTREQSNATLEGLVPDSAELATNDDSAAIAPRSTTPALASTSQVPQIPHCNVFNILRQAEMTEAQYITHVHRTMNERIRQDPSREVGLYHNLLTGEWIIIQGDRASVQLPRPTQDWFSSQAVGEFLVDQSALGTNWIAVAHSHPSTGGVSLSNRFPSGAVGDMGIQVMACARNNGQPQSSIIRYLDAAGNVQQTTFGVDLSQSNPIWISFIDPTTQQVVRHDFADVTSYQDYFQDRFGIQMAPVDPRIDDFLHNRPEPRTIRGATFSGPTDYSRPPGTGLHRDLGDTVGRMDQLGLIPGEHQDRSDTIDDASLVTLDEDSGRDLGREDTVVDFEPQDTAITDGQSSIAANIESEVTGNQLGSEALDPAALDPSVQQPILLPSDPNSQPDPNLAYTLEGNERPPTDLSGRRATVEPIREYRDFQCELVNGLGTRMGSAGFEGSGAGAFRTQILTPSGERQAVVKLYEDTSDYREMLNRELEAARVASRTGYGPVVYGEIRDIRTGYIGFAMGIA